MTEQKTGKLKKSWNLTRATWNALSLDKKLISLPAISATIAITMIALWATLAFTGGTSGQSWALLRESASGPDLTLTGYVTLTILGLFMGIVSTAISGAVIHGAIDRFQGNNPSIKSCLAATRRHLGSLSAFALFSFTIGSVLSEIAARIPFIGGKIVAWLAGAAWGVASFFAIPAIMTSEQPVGPIDATKRSIGLIKQVWGESFIASATIGVVGVLITVVYFTVSAGIIAAAALLTAPNFVLFALGAVALNGLVILFIVLDTLSAFVTAAIYYYATTGESPEGFNKEVLKHSFTTKKAKKVFGA